MTTQLIATAPITYAGKRLRADDPFEASDRDAKLLQLVGKAKPRSAPPAKSKGPAKGKGKGKDSQGRYGRRDMRADP